MILHSILQNKPKTDNFKKFINITSLGSKSYFTQI